jgi:hypothetical protein
MAIGLSTIDCYPSFNAPPIKKYSTLPNPFLSFTVNAIKTSFMRSAYRFFILALTAVLFYQCQREVSYIGSGDSGQVVLPSPVTANLQGNVLDENGQPASNVIIKVGSEIAATDTKGYFRINSAPLDKNTALVTAEKPGYFKALRSFSATSGTNQVVIKLVKKDVSGTVTGANGGDISLSNGTKISLPANGIVKASDNSNYTGTVNVYASYIDPTASDILERVPGSFMANDKDGKRVLLSSYGMMAVELEGTGGEKLQIKSGNTATLTSPIPSSALTSAPATIPLWYVDETTGLWKEEGTATKQGGVYVGTVKHFTYWNCDLPVQTVKFTATLKTAKGEPLVNAQVVIRPASSGYYGASAHGFTDSLGQATGPIPANMNLVMEVMDACHTVAYSKNIGPFNESVDLGTITLPASTPSVVTVKGKLTNCSAANVTKGYAIVTINNAVRYAKVDGNGNFSTNYVWCSTTTANVQALGVDENAQQQGTIVSIPLALPTTDLGTLSACGNSSAQFLNYTIDGTSYSIAPPDSLTAFTQRQNTGVPSTTYIDGIKIGSGNHMNFKFDHTSAAAGTYPITNMSTQSFTNLTIVQPLNVVITNFPQAAGEFYQGSFTGQFKDASNVTHNVTCSFRVRRMF